MYSITELNRAVMKSFLIFQVSSLDPINLLDILTKQNPIVNYAENIDSFTHEMLIKCHADFMWVEIPGWHRRHVQIASG